jgi:hypothetical protein
MSERKQDGRLVSLKISRSFGTTFPLTVGLLVGLLVLSELVCRARPVIEIIPFQAYGTNHIQFEFQIARLKSFVEKYGEPNCIILGTSQSLRNIDPSEFNGAYKRRTGKDVLCYNFSVVGVNLSTTKYFATILMEEFHPEMVILGTSFLDFTEARQSRVDLRFEQNAWIEYQLGTPSLKGWLIDNSNAYRALMFLSYGTSSGMNFEEIQKEARKWDHQLTEYGYGYSDKVENLSEAMKPGFIRNFVDKFGDYTVSDWNMNSFASILDLGQKRGVQIIVVEMPHHPSLAKLRDESGEPHPDIADLKIFMSNVRSKTIDIAESRGAYYVRSNSLASLPADGWHDRYHLNYNGSRLYSLWLAEKLAQAATDGNKQGLTSRP